MSHLFRANWRWCGKLAFVLVLLAGTAAAQDAAELTPSFGNGTLTIMGAGFKAQEVITIMVTVAGGKRQLTTTADAQGNVQVATGIAVRPGQSLELEARGDQGTTMAVTTAVPGMLPNTGVPALPILFILGAAGVLLATGLTLRRRVQHKDSATTSP
jgi:LPXTG-motif cell wall-anchored protein